MEKKSRFLKIILKIVVVIAMTICAFFILEEVLFHKENLNENIEENICEEFEEPIIEEEIEPEEPEIQIQTSELSLIMVGDYLIHNCVYNDAAKNAGYNGYDFRPMLTYIKDKVQGYDLAYYNQETILGGAEIGLSDYPRFNSLYEAGDSMIDSGFNLVSLATNHTMDRGEEAVLNSREYWNSKEDVLAVGSYNSEENRDAIVIKEKNGITYTMLNYTYGTNGLPVPKGKEYLVNVWPTRNSNPETDERYQEYKEIVRQDIEKVRDKVDVLIVAMHWGTEYTHIPTAYQKDEANFLASLGVDIIIGTHPHVIQPIERIENTLVFYSLGNFLSGQKQNDEYNKMVGLMSSVNITKFVEGEESRIEIENTNNELIYTYYANWRNFKVVPFSSNDIGNYLPDYVSVYEKYKDIAKAYDENIIVQNLSEEITE